MAATSDPAWTEHENLQEIWTEDECTRNRPRHETPREAWKRFFGEEMPQAQVMIDHTGECQDAGYPKGCSCPRRESKAVATWDGGDADFYLFDTGRVYCASYDGGYLYELTCSHRKNSAATGQTFMCNCVSRLITEAKTPGTAAGA